MPRPIRKRSTTICSGAVANAATTENAPNNASATSTARLRPIRSPSEPRVIAPSAIPTVLAVMTQVISAACMPNSSAMAGPMNAMDWVSKPSKSAMTTLGLAKSTAAMGSIGIGRLGSIVGSALGGLLLTGIGVSGYFMFLAVPLALAAVATMLVGHRADTVAP